MCTGNFLEEVGRCQFIMFPDEINQQLLQFKRRSLVNDMAPEPIPEGKMLEFYASLPQKEETRLKFLLACLIYRNGLVKYMEIISATSSLRKARRILKTATHPRQKAALSVGLSNKLAVLVHQSLMDKEMLKLLIFDVNV
jgi:hypothetical protein